jgi:hypothetical protein
MLTTTITITIVIVVTIIVVTIIKVDLKANPTSNGVSIIPWKKPGGTGWMGD